MTTDEIYTAIVSGDADDGLDRLMTGIAQRRKTLASRLFDDIQVNDRVKVNAKHIKPRYLDGALATVVDKRISKVSIRFDDDINDPYHKWAGKIAVVSAEHLTKVEV